MSHINGGNDIDDHQRERYIGVPMGEGKMNKRVLAVGRITPDKDGVRKFVRKTSEVYEIPGQEDYVSRRSVTWHFWTDFGPIEGEFDTGGDI